MQGHQDKKKLGGSVGGIKRRLEGLGQREAGGEKEQARSETWPGPVTDRTWKPQS